MGRKLSSLYLLIKCLCLCRTNGHILLGFSLTANIQVKYYRSHFTSLQCALLHVHYIYIPSTGCVLTAPKRNMATAGSKRSHEDSQAESPSPEPNWIRCASMKGTVTLQEILDDVLDKNPKHDSALSMFLASCSCHECDTYGHTGYTRKHGVETLAGEIITFFNYFCPRKIGTPWRAEMERFASALRAVVMHCIKEEYLDKKTWTSSVV
jgi:hypothetical protein